MCASLQGACTEYPNPQHTPSSNEHRKPDTPQIHPSLALLLETFGDFATDLPLRMKPRATSRILISNTSEHRKSPPPSLQFVSPENKFNRAQMCDDMDRLQTQRHSQRRSHRTTWMTRMARIHRYFSIKNSNGHRYFPTRILDRRR